MPTEIIKLARLALVAGLISLSCGVEVGNPHGGGSKGTQRGSLSLALADAPLDSVEQVYFNIAGIRVVPLADDDSQMEPVSLSSGAVGRVNVMELNQGKSLALSSAEVLAVGNYAGIILDLDQKSPASVVEKGGAEYPLPVPEGKRGVYVAQKFTIELDEELSLTFHIDLQRSVVKAIGGDQRYDFVPTAHIIRQQDGGSITGKAPNANAAIVCAYLKRRVDFNDGSMDKIPSGPGPRLNGGGPPPGKPALALEVDRIEAKRPPSYAPDLNVDNDPDMTCPRAFALGKVVNGNYSLFHLWPGEYHLQFFGSDGQLQKVAPTTIVIQPGQQIEVPIK